AIEEMTGVTKEDILGKGDYTYAVPFYGERRPILIDLVLDFDSDYEEKYHFVEKRGNALLAEAFTPSVYGGKGAYLWAIASPIFDSSGKQSGAIESIHDITKRKRVEEDLREQKEFAASLVRHSTVPTFVIDSQHRILHWNHAIEELTGITASEIIGTDRFYRSKNPSLADVVVSRELGEHFEQSKKYGRSKYVSNGLHAENWVSNLGGMRRYVLFDASPIYNSKGELVGALETLQGITQQKEAEEAIHKYAEKLEYSNELKDLFTDILHHDLLNPAGVIRGHTEVLLEMEENEQKRQSLVAIERNTEKLVNIIQRASKFAKLESMEKLEFQEMDIGAILEGVIENFSRRIEDKKMTLEFEANGEYPARVNPVIEDVFANLLFNAIKYSPKESRIIIDIVDDGEDWRVAITDFGDGISDDDKSRLFERFRRADKSGAKGAGLGLAIVKRLINLHGGSVGVDDNPKGKGSVFWVTVRKAR
ncbi:MAG: PAS domain-containing sensor histidine kinase, partial [Methanosarcinaceae archaeon]|nr:PAS domain-containing sensor histidine kinase [Methanosarcinaceae archaeon]